MDVRAGSTGEHLALVGRKIDHTVADDCVAAGIAEPGGLDVALAIGDVGKALGRPQALGLGPPLGDQRALARPLGLLFGVAYWGDHHSPRLSRRQRGLLYSLTLAVYCTSWTFYGAVGAALIASHFPARMRGALLAGFFASASVGSVLGVLLGGYIASHFGWKAAFAVIINAGCAMVLFREELLRAPVVPPRRRDR